MYTLWVQPTGRRAHDETHELPEGRDLLDLEVRLKGARKFRVVVVDRFDEPIAGLHISVQMGSAYLGAQTGEDGIATVTVERPVTEVSVSSWVGATSRYLPSPKRKVRPGEKEVRLVLEEGGVAAGKLVGPDGSVLRRRASIEARRGEQVLTTTIVSADGTFRATVPASGSVDLVLNGQVWSPGVTTNIATEQFFFTGTLRGVTAGTRDLVLRAQAVVFDGSLSVRVLTPDGDPVEGVYVQVYPTRSGKGYTTLRTDAEGRVEFTGLPSRIVAVRYADARRHAALGLSPPSTPEHRTVPQGQEVLFELRAAVRVRGVVTMPDGTPAVGVRVTAHAGGALLSLNSFSDRDGRFEVLVPPDSAGELVIQGTTTRRGDKGTRRYSGHVRVERLGEEVKLRLDLRR